MICVFCPFNVNIWLCNDFVMVSSLLFNESQIEPCSVELRPLFWQFIVIYCHFNFLHLIFIQLTGIQYGICTIMLQESGITMERCKEIIVVYEPQPEMKRGEKMSLIGELCFHDNQILFKIITRKLVNSVNITNFIY